MYCNGLTSLYTPSFLAIALATFLAMTGTSQGKESGDLTQYLNQGAFNSVTEILSRGDVAYKKGQMEEAVNEYKKAQLQADSMVLPKQFKNAVSERYAQGLAQWALKEAYAGNQDKAKELIELALAQDADARGVKEAVKKLSDSIRFNPAGTETNTKNVAEVNESLRMAYGYIDLAEYDKAKSTFEKVLLIDPYNRAARKGMETVDLYKSQYGETARNQTRGNLLSQVAHAWETPLGSKGNANPDLAPEASGDSSLTVHDEVKALWNKLSSMNVARVNLDQVSLQEVMDYVRNQAYKLDTSSDMNKGVNLVLDLGDLNTSSNKAILSKRFNINLNNVPLSEVLRYAGDMAGVQVKYAPHAVRLVSVSSDDEGSMTMRTFRVPTTFFANDGGSGDNSDPFADDSSSSGVSVRRIDARKYFEGMGVTFPAGASVSYSPVSNVLMVRNTPGNLNIIEEMVDSQLGVDQALVVVKTTFLEVSKQKIHELGFDWVINGTGIGGNPGRWLGGGTDTANVVEQMPGPIGDTPNPTEVMTSGLRSGNNVESFDRINALINSGNTRDTGISTDTRAPGILSVRAISTNFDVQVLMRGLHQCKDIDMLEQPQVITKSGEAAVFKDVRTFIYPEDYTEPQVPNSYGNNDYNNNNNNNNNRQETSSMPVTPSHPASFSSEEIGVTLEVTPVLSADKSRLEVSLDPRVIDFDGFIDYGTPIMQATTDSESPTGLGTTVVSENKILKPVFSVKRAQTNVGIYAGSTIVLGGLMKSKKVEYEDKLPVLGDIPLVGRLFRSEGTQTEERVLIIMVSVDVIDPTGRSLSGKEIMPTPSVKPLTE